jgi:signal peptidase I
MTIDWAKHFEYDENSLTCLVWKDKYRLGRGGKPVRRINDGHAGNLSPSGYPVVTLDKRPYSAQKVVWELFNGPVPEGRDILPKDGNALNCKIGNLELNFEIPKDVYKYGSYLAEFFEYDPESPSGLRWKRIYKKGSTSKPGDVVGSNDNGYWRVHALGSHYKAHKIVWALHNNFERQEGLHIDHIDGNPSNNRIENLRLVSEHLNARNKPMMKNNKSGIHGVCFQTVKTKAGNYIERYVAGWRGLDGKPKTKCFSVGKYGAELAEFLAQEYRLHQIDLLNLMGAGYTDRHGT